jgi:hypothetical protein
LISSRTYPLKRLQRRDLSKYQFWQHHNKPIELWSNAVLDQKMGYVHNNPLVSGFVSNPEDWKQSSAGDYAGIKGQVDLCFTSTPPADWSLSDSGNLGGNSEMQTRAVFNRRY